MESQRALGASLRNGRTSCADAPGDVEANGVTTGMDHMASSAR